MSVRTAAPRAVAARPTWRAVAIPSEHGGWGLTGEPIALGLLLAFSWAGVAIGAAAMLAFLARTPLELAMVDRRRDRELERSVLARRIGFAELVAIVALGVTALLVAWMILAARSIGAIPFVRTQIARLHRGEASTRSTSDLFQLLAIAVAAAAAVVDPDVLLGSLAVLVIVALHLVWVRRSPVPPAKVLGIRQMALGFGLVAVTTIGVGLT